ncbi:hypothetical protein [Rhodococcus sp. IEGM 1408]|nr:hypothetical protein [Rhodococcus sp. IEGM 1408]MDV8000071.1 hypothetical protein [Rhodococcus sp. IEGM 1408]
MRAPGKGWEPVPELAGREQEFEPRAFSALVEQAVALRELR